jgi:hypothetical protein
VGTGHVAPSPDRKSPSGPGVGGSQERQERLTVTFFFFGFWGAVGGAHWAFEPHPSPQKTLERNGEASTADMGLSFPLPAGDTAASISRSLNCDLRPLSGGRCLPARPASSPRATDHRPDPQPDPRRPLSTSCRQHFRPEGGGQAAHKQPGRWICLPVKALPGEAAHACNPSTQEAEAGRSQVQGQPGLRGQTLSQNCPGTGHLPQLWQQPGRAGRSPGLWKLPCRTQLWKDGSRNLAPLASRGALGPAVPPGGGLVAFFFL